MAETGKSHGVVLEGRARLTVTGVTEVDSFNEEMVALATGEGALTILGEGLRIGTLNLENGKLLVEGKIDALSYGDRREKGTLMKRMFR